MWSSRGQRGSRFDGAEQVLQLAAAQLSALRREGLLVESVRDCGHCQPLRHVQASQVRGFPQMALKMQRHQLAWDSARFLVELVFVLLPVALY